MMRFPDGFYLFGKTKVGMYGRVGVRKNKDLSMVKELKIFDYGPSGNTIKLKVKQTLPTGEYQQIWNRVNIEHFLSEMINRHTRETHKYEVK